MKKIIFTIGIWILIAAAGVVYFWPGLDRQGSDKIPGANLTMSKLTDSAAIGPYVSTDQSSIWFGDKDGRLYRYDTSKRETTEYPVPVFTKKPLGDIIWPLTGEDVLFIGLEAGKDIYVHYNGKASQFTTMPKEILKVAWMPDGVRALMVWQAADKKSQQLVLANGDGTGYKTVSQLPWPEFDLSVSPNGKEALLVSTKPSSTQNNVYLFDLENGKYRTVVSTGRNVAATWVDSNKFLFYRSDAQTYPRLFLYDMSSERETDLGLNSNPKRTVVDASRSIVYVAQTVNEKHDKVVKIDLNTLNNVNYFDPKENIRISELLARSQDLFFVDGDKANIYEIK